VSAAERWEKLRSLDQELTYQQHELAAHRAAADAEKTRAAALEILILRKQIKEMTRGRK
jgi:hypothetical protein